MIFVKNEIVRFTVGNKMMRVLWVAPRGDTLVAIDMHKPLCSPEWIDVPHWDGMLVQGHMEAVAVDPHLRLPAEETISAAAIAKRNSSWAAISTAVRSEPQIYFPRFRGKLIRDIAAQHELNEDTVRNHIRRYWQRGMSKNALLPDYEKCGNIGQDKGSSGKKRGRPRSDGTVGKNMDEQSRRYFDIAITNHFIGGKRVSFTDVYLIMLTRWYADDITLTHTDGSRYDGTMRKRRQLVIRNPDDIPTIGMCRYWYRKTRDMVLEAKARNGKKYYEKNLRPILGSSVAEAICPGYRYQIDATILDVYIVSKTDRKTIIGRPVLYLVVDVWSRAIVGFHVGIENASWRVAMLSLLNAAEDKVDFCRRFGIDIEPQEWPQQGLSAVILGDRGEMESGMPEQLSNVLGIELENTPPYRADLKGAVERKFLTVQAAYKPFVEGYIDVDYKERGGHDYRLDATLTLYEITQQIIHVVLMHNALPVSKYPMDVEMINDEVFPSPNNLWTWGVANRQGHLHKKDPELIKFATMPATDVSVQPTGIHFFGLRYESKHAEKLKWYSAARMGRTRNEVVSYNPYNLDKIYLHNAFDRQKFEICYLVTEDPFMAGLTLQEWLALRESAAAVKDARKAKTLETKMTAQQNMREINADAINQKAALGLDERSINERTGDILGNRKTELAAMRADERANNARDKPRLHNDNDNSSDIAQQQKSFSVPPIYDLIRDPS